MNHSFILTEWKLLNITADEGEENDFVWVEFMIMLRRNHAFYGKPRLLAGSWPSKSNFQLLLSLKVNHMIFPFGILSSLSKS